MEEEKKEVYSDSQLALLERLTKLEAELEAEESKEDTSTEDEE